MGLIEPGELHWHVESDKFLSFLIDSIKNHTDLAAANQAIAFAGGDELVAQFSCGAF
jgi:hypothetical protein